MSHEPDGPDLSVGSPLGAETVFASSLLFQSLTGDEVREVVRACEEQHFKPGEILFRQGDEAESLFIVVQGELEVVGQSATGEKVVLAVLGPGTVVGELSLIEGGPRSATVAAMSQCQVFRLRSEVFEAMRSACRPAAYKMILGLASTVCQRRRQTDARVQEVFQDPASYVDSFEAQLHEMLGRLRKS